MMERVKMNGSQFCYYASFVKGNWLSRQLMGRRMLFVLLNYCICVLVVTWFQRTFWTIILIIFTRFTITRVPITTQIEC